ncbi:MAG: hypothetical protein B7X02_02820, partial [Rhodospirillales bacterium 12-54-5]
MQWRRIALGILLAHYASTAWAEDAPHEKLQYTLKSLASSKEDAEAIKTKLEAAQNEAKHLQERATALAADLQASEVKASKQEAHYDQVSTQLSAKQKEFNARADEYAQTIRSLLRMQNIPATAIIANPDNIDQLMRTTSVLRHVNGALKERALKLKTETVTLKALQQNAATSKELLDKALATLEAQQTSLNAGIAERQKLQALLAKDHAAALAKVEALSKQSQSLQELISKLEQSRNSIAIAEKTSTKLPPSAAKGQWQLPVAGSILHRFGERKNANESWRGLVLRARAGGSVVAPSAGEVVFTGPFRDYGRMVLIKHKDKHISLLAG